MYFPDLTKLANGALAIGWLSVEKGYSVGQASAEFCRRLLDFCEVQIIITLGYHECEFCDNPPFGLRVEYDNKTLTLGSDDIWAFGADGQVYLAPNLIYHYVTAHNYLPPSEFIEAVLHGLDPASPAYLEKVEKLAHLSF